MSKVKTPKIEELLAAGVHFGHQVRRWYPKMEKYIYTVKKNIHIIDLEQTEANLKEAVEFLYETAKNGGQVILVGTKKQARDIIEIEAKRSGALFVTERWIGGTVTNFKVIKKNIDKLLSLIKRKEAGELEKYTKKERLLMDREIEKLQRYVGGIVSLKGVPSAVVVIDTKREKTAIREANSFKIPVVALVDTNSDPSGVKYVIPGNDDAIKSIALILQTLGTAIEEGYKEFERVKKEGQEILAQNKVLENKALESKTLAAMPEPTNTGLNISGSEKPEMSVKKPSKKVNVDEEIAPVVVKEPENSGEKTKKGRPKKEEAKK
jgi:small subunit ribosomal protein S2